MTKTVCHANYLFTVCVFMHRLEVKGQFAGAGSLLLPHGFQLSSCDQAPFPSATISGHLILSVYVVHVIEAESGIVLVGDWAEYKYTLVI